MYLHQNQKQNKKKTKRANLLTFAYLLFVHSEIYINRLNETEIVSIG